MDDYARARELAAKFGGDPDDVQVGINERHGWGWADVVLSTVADEPYNRTVYDIIGNEWPQACEAVETGVPGADDRLRQLLACFQDLVAED